MAHTPKTTQTNVSSSSTLFTVPTGERYVVKHMHFLNTNAASQTMQLATIVGPFLFTTASMTLAPGAFFDWYPVGMALEAADGLTLSASVGANIVVTCDMDRYIL